MHEVLRLVAGVLALGTALPATAAVAATVPPDGPVKVEAENYARQRGTRVVEVPAASGGRMVDRVSHGDRLRYDAVAVPVAGRAFLCFASPAPVNTDVATVDVRIGSRWAPPVTSIPVRTNLGQQARQWAVGGVVPAGVHTIYLTVRQPAGGRSFALDYLMVSHLPPPPSLNC